MYVCDGVLCVFGNIEKFGGRFGLWLGWKVVVFCFLGCGRR